MINKKWVKILKAARKRIESGEDVFVSSAIRECSLGFNLVGYLFKDDLLGEIRQRCCAYEVCAWMAHFHYGVYMQITDNNQWKEYHLAWIDNMIEEFSGTGAFAPVTTWAD